MNKKIYRSSLLVAFIVLATSIFLIMGVLYEYFEAQLKKELKSEAAYISYAIENEGLNYIESIKDEGERITLIAPDGTVIADTAADINKLENHLNRDEVKQAFEKGSGTSVRYSNTLTEKIVYYAVKLKDGNILRVSTKQYTIITVLLGGLMQPIICVVFLVIILSFVLSLRVSKSIVDPINHIDLERPEENDTYEELAPLLNKIASQRSTIDRQIKNALKQQEEFRLITENMSEGFLIIDKNFKVLTYNSSALKLLEIKEPLSANVFGFNRTKTFREVVEKALSGDRAENEMVSGERHYNLIANTVYDEEEIIGAVIVIFDITERVKREQLRREFTSNVSHELKTPLTSISGFAEIMMNGGTPDEIVADFSKSIYDEAVRLITLVQDIIKISELDEKSVQFESETVDIYELSSEVSERLKHEAEKKNIKISVIGCKANVIGVRKILDEMIYNLCDNAIKYNKENGLVDIIISTQNDKVTLTVRDTGIGISKSDQSRIFERFYRVDKARSKAIGGTGLGLSIVKHGAIYLGADINIESEETVGTKISLIFKEKNS